ncbi:predicted protein [Nematostella vectensis]|uniref:EF-hand domain-containing protein n=1 Tax=Nematostella vectensis TaxID=45351 RepID=A7RVT6_NEMVE|nr:myosin-2 essential light chain [Nematostella vectensis]EDO44509.1 predicted protein [Nematostella vectensis]|eukprot:XP_001636572.1 predicted protein [Nematostella vectensis]
MAAQLTERQIAELTDVFSIYDTVGDGKVESAQLGEVMRAFDLNPTNVEVRKIIKEVDPEGTRRVSFDEFFPVYQSFKGKVARNKAKSDDFVDSLKVFDSDGSGFISAGELRHVLTSIGEKLSDEEADSLFQAVEYNQGQVNYEEFIKYVLST